MLHGKNSVEETYYDVLCVREDASCEEIRRCYRAAILDYHPDKVKSSNGPCDPPNGSGDQFLKIQKAWEILGNASSRANYDGELRASRQDTGIAEDIDLEDFLIEDDGEVFKLFYQCRCGDYFFVDSKELGEMGYTFCRDRSKICFETSDTLPASIVLPCGSCSMHVRLSLNGNKVDGP